MCSRSGRVARGCRRSAPSRQAPLEPCRWQPSSRRCHRPRGQARRLGHHVAGRRAAARRRVARAPTRCRRCCRGRRRRRTPGHGARRRTQCRPWGRISMHSRAPRATAVPAAHAPASSARHRKAGASVATLSAGPQAPPGWTCGFIDLPGTFADRPASGRTAPRARRCGSASARRADRSAARS